MESDLAVAVPSASKQRRPLWWWPALAAFAAIWVISSSTNDLPTCQNSRVTDLVAELIADNSLVSAARDVRTIQQVSSQRTPPVRNCRANLTVDLASSLR